MNPWPPVLMTLYVVTASVSGRADILLRSAVPLDPTGSTAGAMSGTPVYHGVSERGAEQHWYLIPCPGDTLWGRASFYLGSQDSHYRTWRKSLNSSGGENSTPKAELTCGLSTRML